MYITCPVIKNAKNTNSINVSTEYPENNPNCSPILATDITPINC